MKKKLRTLKNVQKLGFCQVKNDEPQAIVLTPPRRVYVRKILRTPTSIHGLVFRIMDLRVFLVKLFAVFRVKNSLTACKIKMAARGPQNGRHGLETGLILGYWPFRAK